MPELITICQAKSGASILRVTHPFTCSDRPSPVLAMLLFQVGLFGCGVRVSGVLAHVVCRAHMLRSLMWMWRTSDTSGPIAGRIRHFGCGFCWNKRCTSDVGGAKDECPRETAQRATCATCATWTRSTILQHPVVGYPQLLGSRKSQQVVESM